MCVCLHAALLKLPALSGEICDTGGGRGGGASGAQGSGSGTGTASGAGGTYSGTYSRKMHKPILVVKHEVFSASRKDHITTDVSVD